MIPSKATSMTPSTAPSGADLDRPLADILRDAGDAKHLRLLVADLEMQLEKSRMEEQRLVAKLAQNRKQRLSVEDAAHLGLRVADLEIKLQRSRKEEERLAAELAQERKQRLSAESALQREESSSKPESSTISNACVLSEDRIQRLKQMSLRIVHWTITSQRLQICGQEQSIWSPNFTIRGIEDCCFQFFPGSKKRNAGFYIQMPKDTIVVARIFIADRSAIHFAQHYDLATRWGPKDVGPRLENEYFDNKSLEIQVEFDEVYNENSEDFTYLVSEKD